MTDRRHETMADDAVAWAMRVRDPAFADWEAFTAWLEADAGHAAAYDAVADAGDVADAAFEAMPALAPARPAVRPVSRRRALGWAGGALAAGIVGAVGLTMLTPDTDPYTVATGPGTRRTIALADGSRIDLNGATRVTLDRRDARVATLERGQALFTVRHDAADPFVVHSGDATIEDVGTVFDVVRDGDVLRLAVAEGAVVYNPTRENVRLTAGQGLRAGGEVAVSRVTAADVGSWRDGRLVYEAAPIAAVAQDLSRSLGIGVAAAPQVAARPFTGVLSTGGDRQAFLARLGPLLDVEVAERQQGIVLRQRTGATAR